MYIQRNNEVLSPNHYFHEKSIFWVCICRLSYPACKAHAPSYVVCGFSGSIEFFHIISQTTGFSERSSKTQMCVFILSTNLCETFLILRKTGWDIIVNVQRSSCKVHILSQCMSRGYSERNKLIEWCRGILAPLLRYKVGRHRPFLSSSENPQLWIECHVNLLENMLLRECFFFLHRHVDF